jgi:hypothetical protein
MKTGDWIRLCGAVLLVTGCAVTEQQKPKKTPQVNLGGYSDTFKQGYADGCESAGARSPRRNEGRYKTEADYMMGWNDGYSACRKGR